MSCSNLVHRPPMRIIGIQCRTSNHPDAAPHDIAKLWERFYNEPICDRIPNKKASDILALYCDYEGDHTMPYSVVIGCQAASLDDIPEGMVAKELPAAAYAVFKAEGEHPKSLIETWGWIWQSGLKRTYTGDFEIYGEKFHGASKEVDVFIAIENTSTSDHKPA